MKYTIHSPLDRLFSNILTVKEVPTLIISDTHAPYQNKHVLELAFDIAKKRGIKQLIHAGDLIDAASYNSQAKNEKVPDIETDIEHARSILYTAQHYFTRIYILPGNHDGFYLKKEKITFQDFIHRIILLDKYKSRVITTEYDYLFYGKFAIIGHMSGYDTVPGKIAAQIANKYNMHAFVGHDHIQGYEIGNNGKYGISIGGMFIPNSFWYKERGMNIFPHSMIGFAIIQEGTIYLYNEKGKETKLYG